MRKIALLVTLAVLGAACARPSNGAGGSTGATGSIEHPTGASDLVLRVETTGGLIAPTAALATVPPFSLFGDGTVVTQGAQIEIYPGPALPPLIETHVTEEGIQAILRAASEAGCSARTRATSAARSPMSGRPRSRWTPRAPRTR